MSTQVTPITAQELVDALELQSFEADNYRQQVQEEYRTRQFLSGSRLNRVEIDAHNAKEAWLRAASMLDRLRAAAS